MERYFDDLDLTTFWDDSEYARKQYLEEKPTTDLIASIEAELGYPLPASYVELMNSQNGGIPRNTCFPTKQPTSWAQDHVAITGIMGIGRNKSHSAEYLKAYPKILALGNGEFSTRGYAPGFVEDWFRERQASGDIVAARTGLGFSEEFSKSLMLRIREFV